MTSVENKDEAKAAKAKEIADKKAAKEQAKAEHGLSKWDAFKSKSFGKLQNVARVIVFPIAILPIAGIFLGIGGGLASAASTNNWGTTAVDIFTIMKTIGNIVFANLGLLFAASVAFGFAKESKGVAAVAGVICFLSMEVTMSALFLPGTNSAGDAVVLFDPWKLAGNFGIISVGENKGMLKSVDGISPTLDLSVLGGIIIGYLTALVHNRTYDIKVPRVLAFFGGEKFVPIATFLMGVGLGLVLFFIWPGVLTLLYSIGSGLGSLMSAGTEANGFNGGRVLGGAAIAFVFGMIERLLIPAGLHHVFYSPFWYTPAGGQWLEPVVSGNVVTGWTTVSGSYTIFFEQMNHMGKTYTLSKDAFDILAENSKYWDLYSSQLSLNGSAVTDSTTAFNSAMTISYSHFTMEVGTVFSSGRFAFMQYGYPFGAAAIIMLSKKENRARTAGIIGSAAATSFLTGITEPILFSFLFVAPLLYIFDAIMAGISFALAFSLNVSVGQGFAAGFIDYSFFGLLPGYGSGTSVLSTNSIFGMWTGRDGALWIPFYGLVIMAPSYFFGFWGIIVWKDYKTPGREDGDDTAIEAVQRSLAKGTKNEGKVKSKEKGAAYSDEYLETIFTGLGGHDNIIVLDNCATRLRVTLKDGSKVDKALLLTTNAVAAVVRGHNVQVIYGGEVQNIKVALERKWQKS